MWLGSSNLTHAPGRHPSPQLHGVIFGWLTWLAQVIKWQKVNPLFWCFLQELACERKLHSPSLQPAGEGEADIGLPHHIFPGSLHIDFTWVYEALPLVLAFALKPAPQHLGSCPRASPRNVLNFLTLTVSGPRPLLPAWVCLFRKLQHGCGGGALPKG